MNNLTKLFVFAVATLVATSCTESKRSGNPIFEGWYADPEGVIFGDTYWVYPTWSKPFPEQLHFDAFSSKVKSGAAGLIQAVLVVAIVWFFAYTLARKFKVEQATAMTLASGCSICGVSACITAAGVAGTDKKQLSYIISLVLIIVVPMIYLMPWLASVVVPLFTDDPAIQNEIAGAWIGGTIDTTSGVGASSEMAGEAAQKTAIVVKATQNVLIGVVAFFIALYLSSRGEGKKGAPSLSIVWDKFPKFILGFVIASAVFSVLQAEDLLTLNAKGKIMETSLAKTFSTFFFSLSFVCIGMDTRLKDIISKENRNALYAFLGAQTFNIVVTMLIAWLMFGVVKPAIWPSTPETPATEQVVEAAQPTEANEATDAPTIVFEGPIEAAEIAFDESK